MEWMMLDNNYDFKSEIRNSGYADMLNDHDRNMKYYKALKEVIKQMKKKNIKIHVLDIGCGTGILSMMALILGADKVTACESFQPMYECAKNVLERNNMLSNKIDLIFCNSLDLKIGFNMKEKANVLVSEIFDTELIGEGVLPTFNHALKHLLTDDAVIIPFKANVYVQVIDSEFLNLHSWLNNNRFIHTLPSSYETCAGYSSVFDIQASALVNYRHEKIGQPILTCEIEFAKDSSVFTSKKMCRVPYEGDGDCFSLVLWWELIMTSSGDHRICTAPSWISSGQYHWRDHWLQGVFNLRNDNSISRSIDFRVSHDSFSFWVDKCFPNNSETVDEKPFCTCGLHSHIPHHRIYQLNSDEYLRQMEYVTQFAIATAVDAAVIISDLSVLSISLSQIGVMTHTVIDNDSVRALAQELAACNGCERTSWSNLEDFFPNKTCTRVGIFGDPFFIYSIFPWDHIHFWYSADLVRKKYANVEWHLSPQKMTIKAVLVRFEHLQKINKPTGFIGDFNLQPFDDIIHRDIDFEDLSFETKFLWEYDCFVRSEICDLLTIDMTQSISDLYSANVIELRTNSRFTPIDGLNINGLVLWTTWELTDGVWIDNSLQSINRADGKITWKPYTKQAVHFLQDLPTATYTQLELQCVLDLRNSNFRFSIVFEDC